MTGDYRLVFVLGSGRCGSTLLDLVMNGHSEVLGLGELSTLGTAARPLEGDDGSADDPYVTFWRAVRAGYEERTGRSWDDLELQHGRWPDVVRWTGARLDEWHQRNLAVLDSASKVSGRQILMDASKWPQRLSLLRRGTPPLDLWVVELVRDGRAVTNSYIQRYDDFWGGLRVWMTSSIAGSLLRRRVPSGRWLKIRYEDLAREPERTLRAVCVHLGIDYEPGMLDFRNSPYFGLGGNPNTRSSGEEGFSLDERWRRQMPKRRRRQFAIVGGWLNRAYGGR